MNVRIVVLLFSLLTVAGMARGADPSRLTTDGAEKAALVLSPDGTRAVFLLHRTTGSGYDICVLDLAVGGPARNLTASLAEGLPLESSRQFAVSLDGLAVLYVHDYEIWRVGLDGAEPPVKVTQDAGAESIFVHPAWKEVLFTAYQPLDLTKIKGPIPKEAAGVLMVKIYRLDLASLAVTMLDPDLVADDHHILAAPDGRLVVIGGFLGSDGRFDDRAITLLDAQGNRTRTKLSAPYRFQPAYLLGGELLVVVDQVSRGDRMVRILKGWHRTRDREDELDLPLEGGREPDYLWAVPGHRSLLLSASGTTGGEDLYRYAPETQELRRLTEKGFSGAWDGGVTPDGRRLVFIGALPGEKGNEVWSLELSPEPAIKP